MLFGGFLSFSNEESRFFVWVFLESGCHCLYNEKKNERVEQYDEKKNPWLYLWRISFGGISLLAE